MAPAAPASLDADTLAMVQKFVKTPTEALPPSAIDRFLAVDAASLPKDLRRPFAAKRIALYTLRQLLHNQKRGTVRMRMPGAECEMPEATVGQTPEILRSAGFSEIFEEEELFLMDKTKCTEDDLMCEFTLRITVELNKKKQKVRRLFMHEKDPLQAFLGEYRVKGKAGGNTNFFRTMPPTCVH